MFKAGDIVLCVKGNPYPANHLLSKLFCLPKVAKHYTIRQIEQDCECGARIVRLAEIINPRIESPYYARCGNCRRILYSELSFPTYWFIKLNDQDLKEPAENYETILNTAKSSFAKEAERLVKRFKELITS